MRGEINIQSLEKKYHPEAARNRAEVQAFLNRPDRFVTPVVRQKLTEDDRTDLRIAKANFRARNGAAWDNKWARKKAQRKALTKTETMKR